MEQQNSKTLHSSLRSKFISRHFRLGRISKLGIILKRNKKIFFKGFLLMFAPLRAFCMSDGQIFTWQHWEMATRLSHCKTPWEWRGKENRKCLFISKISGARKIYLMRLCVVSLRSKKKREKLQIVLPNAFWSRLRWKNIDEITHKALKTVF